MMSLAGADSRSVRAFAYGVNLLGELNGLLISGKRSTSQASTKLKDRIYAFGGDGNYVESFEPSLERCNIRLVQDPDGVIYQVNCETGIVRFDATDKVIVPSGQTTYANEPRYNKSATVYVGIQGQGSNSAGRPILDAAFDGQYVYVVPVVVDPVGNEPYTAAAKLQLLDSGNPPYQVVRLYDEAPLAGDNQHRNALREIEIDSDGNLYVINAHNLNESDILWRYYPDGSFERLDLGRPDSNTFIPDPVAMHMSSTTATLYLASAQYNPADASSTTVHGFSVGETLTLEKSITINSMQHVTGITEDTTEGCLWVVGFNMDYIPQYPNPTQPAFYDPYLAKVPYDSNSAQAQPISGSDDLALPMSILWNTTAK